MRQPATVQLGDIGETAAALFFKQLGWGPMGSGSQDLGTDLFIQLRNANRVDLRLLLGAQVKTGDSWFDRPGTVDGREGWWYSEETKDHAEYWSNHHVAHILILQSEDCTTTRIWTALDRKAIIDTGKGFKVFVPAEQRLDRSHFDDWIELAEEARETLALEGSRWSFSVADLQESAWARHALIAPRLVAPHPNKGYASPITWVEALALCIEAQPDRWDHFATRFEEVPAVADAAAGQNPGWRLAAAAHRWITEGTAESLRSVDLPGADRGLRVARAVCLSAAEYDNFDFGAALRALEAELQANEISVDQAWLNVHRARILAETGRSQDALEILEHTNVLMAGVANDVTVSALRSVVLWSIFEMADRFDADLSKVVPAMDTAIAWWRNQSAARGLEDAAERTFEAWGRDRARRFASSHVAHNELFSAALTARLAGDHGSWRSSLGLLAMVDLSMQAPDGPSVEASIEALRKAGSESQLRLALSKILEDGPLADLTGFMATIRPETITRTTWRADLAALTVAGSYCPPEHAAKLIHFLFEGLQTPDVPARSFADFRPSHRILEALWGMRDHFDRAQAEWVTGFALSLGPGADQLLERHLGALLDNIDPEVLAERETDFTSKANDDTLPGWLRHIFAAHSPAAREVLGRALMEGNVGAVSALGRIDRLTAEEAIALTRACATAFEGFNRAHGSIAGHVIDMAHLCTSLAFHFPDAGAWDVLMEFLCDQDTYPAPKRAACKLLAEYPEKLQEENKVRLEHALPTLIADSRPELSVPLPFRSGIGGAFQELLLVLLSPNHPSRTALEGALLAGGETARSDAVDYYSRRPGSESILLALARDANHEVAGRAVFGLARLASRSEIDGTFVRALSELAAADGEGNAHRVLGGLEMGALHGELASLVAALTQHPSARVRRRAGRLAESTPPV